MRIGLRLAPLVLAAACVVPLDPPPAGAPDGGGPPREGGVLRLAEREEPRTLDPAIGYDVVSWSFEQMVFNGLVDYDAGTEIVPALAASWETSPDGRRYTFRLRPDVRFSTGRPFASNDVRYSLERLLTPAVHSQGAEFFHGIEGVTDFVAGRTPHVAGIATPAADVVVFTLLESDPLFLHKLAMPFAAVVEREAAEREGVTGFGRRPVGTGPFMVELWRYNQQLRLARNPHYFRPDRPRLDAVDVTIGPSDQLAWFKYQRGELDIASIPSAEFARVLTDARYRALLLQRTTLRTQYLGLNCSEPPFDRPAARRAMSFAVDRARLLELIDGRGVVASTVLPPDMPGFDPDVPRYPHDPAAARAALAEAGLAGGFATTLWATRDDVMQRTAQSIQADLGAIGVEVAIKPVDFPALIEAVRHPGHVPAFLLGWEADFPDPSNFLTVLLHSRNRTSNNHAFYADPDVDRLLDAADATTDPPSRMRLFHAAEVRILRDAPWVPLHHPVSYVVRHPRVRDYGLHPLRPARVDETWLAS